MNSGLSDQAITLAVLASIVTCFLAVLIVVCINPALVDKMTALGAGVVLGGLLGALNTAGRGQRPSSPPPSIPPSSPPEKSQ